MNSRKILQISYVHIILTPETIIAIKRILFDCASDCARYMAIDTHTTWDLE